MLVDLATSRSIVAFVSASLSIEHPSHLAGVSIDHRHVVAWHPIDHPIDHRHVVAWHPIDVWCCSAQPIDTPQHCWQHPSAIDQRSASITSRANACVSVSLCVMPITLHKLCVVANTCMQLSLSLTYIADNLGTCLHHHHHDRLITSNACCMHHCVAIDVCCIDIGCMIDQHLGHCCMCIDACNMQRCVASAAIHHSIDKLADIGACHCNLLLHLIHLACCTCLTKQCCLGGLG
jgi:hypothetical protein